MLFAKTSQAITLEHFKSEKKIFGKTGTFQMLTQLVLVLTHKCNANCGYCPVEKNNKQLKPEDAYQAIRLFLEINSKINPQKKLFVKLFGGEPLICFYQIKKIIAYIKDNYGGANLVFDITTNGVLLLNEKIINFILKNKNIRVFLSMDGMPESSLKNRKGISRIIYKKLLDDSKIKNIENLTVNMVIAPNQTGIFFDNFEHLCCKGFNRFNILPAYFVKWTDKEVQVLKKEFDKIILFARNHPEYGIVFHNSGIFGRMPFFNEGMVVDCDGGIFFNNIFLSKDFSHLRNQLKVDNIKEINENKILRHK